MTANHYRNSFTAHKTAADVYEALTRKIDKWWSTDFEGSAAGVGDQFTVRFGNSFKTFEVEQAEPDSKIIWRCLSQHIDHPQINDQTEWIGTAIIWTIEPGPLSVKVTLVHDGLVPSAQCYGVCEKGWDTFIASLFALIEGGVGLPFLK